MTSEGITLKRMNHSWSLIQFLERLIESSSLVDCTIAAEGQYLKAHKVILSAYSSYFELLFSQENEKNPIVILKDIKFEILKAVIDFIYRGQIEIRRDQLMSFVAAVDSLQIKGVENESENMDVENRGDASDLLPYVLVEKTGVQAQPSPSSVETEWRECNSLSSFHTKIETEQESSTEMFPVENKFRLETEEVGETTRLSERNEKNAEESKVACCSQADAYHFETVEISKESVSSSGPPRASENSAQAEFRSGGAYVRPNGPQLAACSSSENPPHAGSSSCTRGVCSVVPKHEVVVDEMPILESHEREEAGHSTTELKNSRSAGECTGAAAAVTEEGCEKKLPPRSKRNAKVQSYACVHCHETFDSRRSLCAHRRIHKGERRFPCGECHKSFTQKGVLIRHQRTHTGERPFSCSVCHKSFALKATLTDHQRTHTGERPYSCSECHKSFALKSTLIDHQRSHTGERPYSCAECYRSFAHKSTLTSHQRTHTRERPYSCSECHKSFSLKGVLIGHQRTHTGEKPYSCSVCHRSFSKKANVWRHLQTHKEK